MKMYAFISSVLCFFALASFCLPSTRAEGDLYEYLAEKQKSKYFSYVSTSCTFKLFLINNQTFLKQNHLF